MVVTDTGVRTDKDLYQQAAASNYKHVMHIIMAN